MRRKEEGRVKKGQRENRQTVCHPSLTVDSPLVRHNPFSAFFPTPWEHRLTAAWKVAERIVGAGFSHRR